MNYIKALPALDPLIQRAVYNGSMSRKRRILVGVDEAGRGPLAGPLAVGIVVLPRRYLKEFAQIRDSKKLTSAKRQIWFDKLRKERKRGTLDFRVSCVGNAIIDKKGISYAARCGIRRCLQRLEVSPAQSEILLDGLLYAPKKFLLQKTVIKGDERVPIIALASVAAKVVRDGKMTRLAKRFPQYGFEIHKGYGTALHRKRILKHGPSPIHRRSFLKNFAK